MSKTTNNKDSEIKLFMAKIDEFIHSDAYITELHNKFKTKIFLHKNEYNEKTHHFFIEKILKYIDYFLSTGPLTKNEHKLFLNAVKLMKEYYAEQLNKTDLFDIVFPHKNTPVYALFFTHSPNPETITLEYKL